jgi:pimeloyl-ACP methyl ester carboxylesterase
VSPTLDPVDDIKPGSITRPYIEFSDRGWENSIARRRPYATAAAVTGAALVIAALANRHFAKKAERRNPPKGRFLHIDGVWLHYVDRGRGDPVVLLHGNGSMIQDFEVSGLIDRAAEKYRVIAFDRPGYGHSNRPRGTIWTPYAQSNLIQKALHGIGVSAATVVGHSWGASVALSLALKHPETVASLVLASGYYYPTPRADVAILATPAAPVLGDILSHTVSPIISRLMWPLLLRKIFHPSQVPEKFKAFPKEMTFRPSQIRASAQESALLIPDAFNLQAYYPKLKMPVVIIAGDGDRLVDIDRQSARLHHDIKHSKLHRVPGVGHMVHQNATKAVMMAIDEAAIGARDGRMHRKMDLGS